MGQARSEMEMSNRERVGRCAKVMMVSREPLLRVLADLLAVLSATWSILPMSVRHAALRACDEIDGGAASRES